jgi:hypothetical protein
MIQAVSVAAAEALNKFLQNGKELMICSEFVYRAYDEAVQGSANPFHLQVPGIALESVTVGGPLPAGVDPESILAKLQRNPELMMNGFAAAKESVLAAPVPLDFDVLEAQAEAVVAEYLAEQRYGRQPVVARTEDYVSDAQVATAVSRFAISLTAARHRATTGAAPHESLAVATEEGFSPSSLPPALQNLFRTPADFVTPGDLRKSASLVEVGRIF